MGDKYNLFMVEEPNSEGPDLRGGPCVSFGMLHKEVSEPGMAICDCSIVILSHYWFLGGARNCISVILAKPISLRAFSVSKTVMYQCEVGHFWLLSPKKVKLSIPFFIPNITLGSFGAITQFKSILLDRKTKVDISLAIPFAGATLSFSMFAVGLLLSSNLNAAGDLVQVPSMLFQGSLLLGLISRATLGYACGLTMSAFNMIPVGCLDGGRAIQIADLRSSEVEMVARHGGRRANKGGDLRDFAAYHTSST
ncbi:hypothetical protein LOK49_LG12G02178 [Camellia lanceoleosa]|uniref:Uncharacterized protein n=1 Tax=Camellia lanceoleosa TaxID=1840588 RepID=A0ACC0FU08_9ERIC|nr:hypothetical protein LOK49_LG12G02178 [Camellia lanceoleosa]